MKIKNGTIIFYALVMITFPSCKINLGLQVVAKRDDGYHEISSLMYPIHGLSDAIEILATVGEGCEFTGSGLIVDCQDSDNLCVKAYNLMRERYGVGGVKIHLHKRIPFGAGLGGGSSDAAAVIKMLNTMFGIGLSVAEMEQVAGELGSDTAFFITEKPAYVSGRGEILKPANISLSGYYIVIAKPPMSVSTRVAYSGIEPKAPTQAIFEIVNRPMNQWRKLLKNDFEESVASKIPEITQLIAKFYDEGAIYASMSGSGSAVFGLFCEKNNRIFSPLNYTVYQGFTK